MTFIVQVTCHHICIGPVLAASFALVEVNVGNLRLTVDVHEALALVRSLDCLVHLVVAEIVSATVMTVINRTL